MDMKAHNEAVLNKLYLPFAGTARQLLHLTEVAGLKGGFFQGLRTYKQQDALYAKGRTTEGPIVTNAKGGYSWHNFGLAVDYVFWDGKRWTWEGDYARIGIIAKNLGLEWGGSWTKFPDRPHIQHTFGTTLEKLREVYEKKHSLKAVYSYLDTLE